MPIVDDIIALYRERGEAMYFGESVTQLAHALQTAWQAERDGADDALVVAALLHDIGHLLHRRGEEVADRGIDARHQDIGATWLEQRFSTEVSEPVRWHVAAKRYLCSVEPSYLRGLSPSSVQSLMLQGGPFTAEAIAEFMAKPVSHVAVRLRRWDDGAKVAGLQTPDIEHYRGYLERMAR